MLLRGAVRWELRTGNPECWSWEPGRGGRQGLKDSWGWGLEVWWALFRSGSLASCKGEDEGIIKVVFKSTRCQGFLGMKGKPGRDSQRKLDWLQVS